MEPRVTALLTIGAFARTSRLSIKALRLYDESGLLPPVCIDPETGYRYYDPAQLERARLVVWLRRLDMPLARIRLVCDLCETDRQLRRTTVTKRHGDLYKAARDVNWGDPWPDPGPEKA